MSTHKLLGRAEVKAAPDTKPYEFAVPEWGGSVLLRPLLCWEREAWEAEMAIARQTQDGGLPQWHIARFVRRGLLNPDGTHMYSEDASDIKELAGKGSAALGRLFAEIALKSGVSAEAQEKLEKNSATTQPEGSSSPSV